MKKIKNKDENKTAAIGFRTTPSIRKMMEVLAERGFRSMARECERLIIEAYAKL